jgi:hypothetical protein
MRAEQQARRDAEQAAQTAREAAGAIYCWLTFKRDPVTGSPAYLILRIVNQTSVPAYDWSIAVEGQSLALSNADYGPILPGSTDLELRQREWEPLTRVPIIPRVEITFGALNGETLTRTYAGTLAA